MASNYPGSLDTWTDKVDGVDDVDAAHVNNLQDAVEAVQTELGTDPAGSSATVKARLDALDTTVAGKASASLDADGTLTVNGTTVELATDGQVAALSGAVSATIVHNGTSYPARPAGYASVRYIGPTQPTTWLSGDEWVNNS